MSAKIGEQTPQERFAAADSELTSARIAYFEAKRALKRFDMENPILDAELTEEREYLQTAQSQAMEIIKEKEQVQRFMHHELYAMQQKWGRGNEFYRK